MLPSALLAAAVLLAPPAATAPSHRRLPFSGLTATTAAADGSDRFLDPGGRSPLVLVPGQGPFPAIAVSEREVTVLEYREFLDRTAHPAPPSWSEQLGRPSYPVVDVKWRDAAAFCRWAGGRLPTIEEWRRAAGIERRAFPWGNARPVLRQLEPTPPALAGKLLPSSRIRPPGQVPLDITRRGLADLTWNVREWCADAQGKWWHAAMGGAVGDDVRALQNLNKVSWLRRETRARNLGFRLVRDR